MVRERWSGPAAAHDDDAVLLVANANTPPPPCNTRSTPPVPRALKLANSLRSRSGHARRHRNSPSPQSMYSARPVSNERARRNTTQRRVIEILKTLRKPPAPTKMITRSSPATEDSDDEDSVVVVADSDGSDKPERRRTRNSLQEGGARHTVGFVPVSDGSGSPGSDDSASLLPPQPPVIETRKLRSSSRGPSADHDVVRGGAVPKAKQRRGAESPDVQHLSATPGRRSRGNVASSGSAMASAGFRRTWVNADAEAAARGMGKGLGRGKGKGRGILDGVSKMNRIDIHQVLTVVVEADPESLPGEVVEGYDIRHTRSMHSTTLTPQRPGSPSARRSRSPALRAAADEAAPSSPKLVPASPWSSLPRLPSVAINPVEGCLHVTGLGKLNKNAIVDLNRAQPVDVLTPSFVTREPRACDERLFRLPPTPLRWQEPSFLELESTVEYEMDDDDQEFLDRQDESHTGLDVSMPRLLRPDFETLMDMCEKEVIRQKLLPARPDADEMPFAIQDDEDEDELRLLPQPATPDPHQQLQPQPPRPPSGSPQAPPQQPALAALVTRAPTAASTAATASPTSHAAPHSPATTKKRKRAPPPQHRRSRPPTPSASSSPTPRSQPASPGPTGRPSTPSIPSPPPRRRPLPPPPMNSAPVSPKPDPETGCGVCGSVRGSLVACRQCGVRVHTRCYHGQSIPSHTWTCRRCLVGNGRRITCALCDGDRGALLPTTTSSSGDGPPPKWVHPACALTLESKAPLIPRPSDTLNPFATKPSYLFDVCSMAPGTDPIGHSGIHPCYLCGRGGRTIKCSHGCCDHYFHGVCAMAASSYLIGGRTAAVQSQRRRQLCPVHLDLEMSLSAASPLLSVPLPRGRGFSSSLDGQQLQFKLADLCSVVAAKFGARRACVVPPNFWRYWLFKRLRSRHRTFTPQYKMAMQRKEKYERLLKITTPPSPAVRRAIQRSGLDTFMRPEQEVRIQNTNEYRTLRTIRGQMETLRLLVDLSKKRERHKFVRSQIVAEEFVTQVKAAQAGEDVSELGEEQQHSSEED